MLYEYHFTHSYRPESFFFWGDRKVVTRIKVAAKGGEGDWTGLDFHVVVAFCVAFVWFGT